MKWYAIKGPDGRILDYTNSSHRKSCWAALRIPRVLVRRECFKAMADRLGYRCVEVEIVEAGAESQAIISESPAWRSWSRRWMRPPTDCGSSSTAGRATAKSA